MRIRLVRCVSRVARGRPPHCPRKDHVGRKRNEFGRVSASVTRGRNVPVLHTMGALATGVSSLQDRLADAALILIRLRPDDIPEGQLRRTFEGVMDDLSFAEAQGQEGRIAATMKITNDEDARALAGRIFGLFIEMLDRGRAAE